VLPASEHPVLRRNNVRVIGSHKPTLIFCHGFGCNQQIWRYLIPVLATRYQLVLFDHVGAGDSDPGAYEPQKYGVLDGYAQDMVEICQVLDLYDAVVVAHSVGATIAMLAAIQEPNRFAQLVLLAPSPCYLNSTDYYGGFEREDVCQLLECMDADYNSWSHMFAQLLMGPANPMSLSEELASYFCSTDSSMAKSFARVAFLSDYRSQVSWVMVPTVVLQCSQDAVAPAEVGAYLLNHLPQGTLVTLQATGHCPHVSAPIETLAVLEDCLVY